MCVRFFAWLRRDNPHRLGLHAGTGSIQSGQRHPITTRRRTVLLGLLTIERYGSTLRPALAVYVVLVREELSEGKFVLTALGGKVSRIC
jgi:hypothetical protein